MPSPWKGLQMKKHVLQDEHGFDFVTVGDPAGDLEFSVFLGLVP